MALEPGFIYGLGIVVRLSAKITSSIADLLVSKSANFKLSAQERVALQALSAALQAWLALRPFPGADDSPGTLE